MSTLRSRLPSWQDLWLSFSATAFLIHFWALLNYLREVPGYMNRLTSGEMMAVLAYVLAFSLLETVGAVLLITILAAFTPRRFLLDRFVPQSIILIYVPGLWVIPIHYQARLQSVIGPASMLYTLAVIVWLLTFVMALVDFSLVFRRHPRFEAGLRAYADKMGVLAGLYLVLDILAAAAIVVRNL